MIENRNAKGLEEKKLESRDKFADKMVEIEGEFDLGQKTIEKVTSVGHQTIGNVRHVRLT